MNAETKQQRASWKPGLQGAVKKLRVASLPPTLSSNSTHSVYSNTTSRFSGSGSPPIVDFTEWADNFRGQRFGFSIPNEFPRDTPRSGPHSMLHNNGGTRGWRIDHSVLLNALRPLLNSQDKDLEVILNVEEIAALHRQDRECLMKRAQMGSTGNMIVNPCIDGVIGKPLSEIFLHASQPIPIAGTEHLIPTIVVKCVEELYRTGLYQAQLFRKTPNFVRVEELVEIYDHREPSKTIRIAGQRPHQNQLYTPPSTSAFGAQTSLHMETTENICALLRTFLQYLPQPILSTCLFEAIWTCCGVRQEAFHSNHAPSHMRAPLNSLGSSLSSEELARIYKAQIMLHLLPTPNFSLMVYLLSFFSQVVMVHEENGLAINDVASMFGAIVFGGASERIVSWTDSKPRPHGEIMMRWFLRRWRQIYHGLFPYDDEGRPSSSGISSLSPRYDADKSVSMARPTSGYFGLKGPTMAPSHDVSSCDPKQTEEQERPRSKVKTLTSEPTLKASSVPSSNNPADHSKLAPPALRNALESSELTDNYLEEVWPHLTSDLRVKMNERMLDVMLEPLITNSSTMSRQRSNSVPIRIKHSSHTAPNNTPAMQRQLDRATHRIVELERWMQKHQQVLQNTITENQRIKQDKSMLEVRVKGLEVELELRDVRYKESEERVRKGLKETVEGVVRERDQAREIVSEIQRLSLSSVVDAGSRAPALSEGFTRN